VELIVTPAGASIYGKGEEELQPEPPDVYQQAVKTLEKYSWLVLIKLFLLFNLIYWPWLIIMSGYNEPHNQTVYYS